MKRYVVSDIRVQPDFSDYAYAIAQHIGVHVNDIYNIKLTKKSIDARHGFAYVLSFAFETDKAPKNAKEYFQPINVFDNVPKVVESDRPIIVGTGPSGLFCAYLLARAGMRPILLERGDSIENRVKQVNSFWQTRKLNEQTNVQFGAGGAGTFSDGKLNTGIKDSSISSVFDLFYQMGAPESILYSAAPHIGTDKLRNIVNNIIDDLSKMGAEVCFLTTMQDIVVKNGAVCGVICVERQKERFIACKDLVFAAGQSAEDSIKMLYAAGVPMESKPFSIGVRIEHERAMIDHSMYGEQACIRWKPSAADYKLSTHIAGRGVYSFCMCPGGVVVPAACHSGRLVTNGMSYSDRNEKNSNSALLVSVFTSDYPNEGPLAGLEFREYWERKVYSLAGDFRATAQNTVDFLKKKKSQAFSVQPSYACGVVSEEIDGLLPNFAVKALREGIKEFGKKIKGFDKKGVLTAIESRSSSPVRILRDKKGESAIRGLYPCGEGAGYAGGIVSAAVDGIKTARTIIDKYMI